MPLGHTSCVRPGIHFLAAFFPVAGVHVVTSQAAGAVAAAFAGGSSAPSRLKSRVGGGGVKKRGPAGEIADRGCRSAGAASTAVLAVVGKSVTAVMSAVSLLLRQGLTGRYGVGRYGPAAKRVAAKGSRPAEMQERRDRVVPVPHERETFPSRLALGFRSCGAVGIWWPRAPFWAVRGDTKGGSSQIQSPSHTILAPPL